jgi:hypothetical protein
MKNNENHQTNNFCELIIEWFKFDSFWCTQTKYRPKERFQSYQWPSSLFNQIKMISFK